MAYHVSPVMIVRRHKKSKQKLALITLTLVLVGGASSVYFFRSRNAKQTTHDIAGQTVATSASTSTTTESPQPANEQSSAPSTSSSPAQVLGLSRWKLTLPIDTDHAGQPDEIQQPELQNFSNDYFRLTDDGVAVAFRTPADGATTKNSKYPRSELREMDAQNKPSSWSNASGEHTMTIRQAITQLPEKKPEVVAGQIHDTEDDVIMIRLEGKKLFVESGGKNVGSLDDNYKLGTIFTVVVHAANGRIDVAYNDQPKVSIARSGGGYYFKAGCYLQSNPSRGDSANAYGEVVIYDLEVSHS